MLMLGLFVTATLLVTIWQASSIGQVENFVTHFVLTIASSKEVFKAYLVQDLQQTEAYAAESDQLLQSTSKDLCTQSFIHCVQHLHAQQEQAPQPWSQMQAPNRFRLHRPAAQQCVLCTPRINYVCSMVACTILQWWRV